MTMDALHGMLRSIRTETKANGEHLTVFREFLAHLDAVQRRAAAAPLRPKPPPPRRKAKRRAAPR
jgi:hypothetical protein